MAEYTYKDVIIDPEDPRVEIGKEYYFGETPAEVLHHARKDKDVAVLQMVEKDWDDPFIENLGYRHICIIRKKKPEKIYVPFDLSKEEDRARLRNAWVREKDSGREFAVTAIYLDDKPPFVELNDKGFIAEELLESYEFLDGTSCGKLMEEEE